jgi:hypothetical protein
MAAYQRFQRKQITGMALCMFWIVADPDPLGSASFFRFCNIPDGNGSRCEDFFLLSTSNNSLQHDLIHDLICTAGKCTNTNDVLVAHN